MAVRPSSLVFGGLHLFDVEPLVIGVVFENVKFLEMGLGVELCGDTGSPLDPDDTGSTLDADLVLEANLTAWGKISYLHLQINGLVAADLLFACHIVCMT